MKRLAIIGAGDLGSQIAYHALNDGHYIPVGFFDDSKSVGSKSYDLPILGKTDQITELFEKGDFDVLMIGIGYKHFELRAGFFNKFYQQIPFGNIIHSSAYVDRSCKLGEGIFVYPGCTLDMNVELANNTLLNVGCIIAHDTSIGAHSFLSPAVKVAGFVKVGEKVNLGINTTVIDNITIAAGVKTGGGAVVTKNLDLPGLYVGIPAAFKKEL